MLETSEVNLIDVALIIPSPYQPRQKIRDIEGLADSIKDIGLIEPISVRAKNGCYELIVGERRWRAAQLAGLSEILAVVRDVSDSKARQMTLAENVVREDLSPIEAVIAWSEHLDAEMWCETEYRELTIVAGWPDEFNRQQARQRARWLLMKLDSDRRNNTDSFTNKFVGKVESIFNRHPKRLKWQSFFIHDIPLLDLPDPVQELAIDKSLNKSQTKGLGEVAKKDKGEFENIVQKGTVLVEDDFEFEEVPIAEASSREIKSSSKARRKKECRLEEEDVNPSPLPEGRYRCLVIDPPWSMQKIEREVRPNQGEGLDYPTLSLEEIDVQFGQFVEQLADPVGCHVYLWATHKYLPFALDMFERHDVKYQCLMTWVKNVGMTPYSWMYDTEHVLFGRVGNLQLSQLGLRLSFSAPVTKHSEKPDIFYERARQASPEPRLNLYARKPRKGFESWGNEAA